MPVNEALIPLDVVVTATLPVLPYQTTPAGWLGAFETTIEQDDAFGLEAIA